MASIFGLISKIPYIGGLFFSLTYLYIFGAIFAIFTIFVMLVLLVYSPIIVSSLDEDSMGTVLTFIYSMEISCPNNSITNTHTTRLCLYVFFCLYCLTGLKVINLLFGSSLLLGQNLDKITSTAFSKALPFEVLKDLSR